MIEYFVGINLIITVVGMTYLFFKMRQPVIIRKGNPTSKSDVPDLSDIGDILEDAKPEIVRNMKLNEEQERILDTWITTIKTTTKSKLCRWVLEKLEGMA